MYKVNPILTPLDSVWLVVYDNVSSADVLQPFWPASSHGHAILTTRSTTLAFDYATESIEIYTWDHKTGSEFLLFLLKKEIGKDINTEGISALELSKRLSGHALSITHMAGLIQRRSWSITEFTSIYLRDPRRAHTNELQRLWEFSFKSMERESQILLGAFSFLLPDNIPQSLFEIHQELLPRRLKFCGNEFRLVSPMPTSPSRASHR